MLYDELPSQIITGDQFMKIALMTIVSVLALTNVSFAQQANASDTQNFACLVSEAIGAPLAVVSGNSSAPVIEQPGQGADLSFQVVSPTLGPINIMASLTNTHVQDLSIFFTPPGSSQRISATGLGRVSLKYGNISINCQPDKDAPAQQN